MILSIDSNDANSAPLYKETISSLGSAAESMTKELEDVGVLVARILMPILFIMAGWGKITGYAGTQQYMEAVGIPGFMLLLVILLEFGGGLAILFGFLTRTTVLFTADFTLLAVFLSHSNFAEGMNLLMFTKDLAISGEFLLLVITGPGAFSIDRLLNKKWQARAIPDNRKRGGSSSFLLLEGRKMGQLIDGVWYNTWYDTKSTGGKFQHSASAFRNQLTADGVLGPTDKGGFIAEEDRYHLYVPPACPWAHHTLIMCKLKGLEPFISVSIVNLLMLKDDWIFDDSLPGATGDILYQYELLYQLYLHADPHYNGRVTVPVLWDKKNHITVSNGSAEIIRTLSTVSDALGVEAGDYYPPALQPKIDELNGQTYDTVNNGVYKAGPATSQQVYDEAVMKVFGLLARLEQILGQHRYLTGNQLIEADIRLWTTLVCFDPVYVTHFKCDKHRISDHLNLYGFLRDIYQMPGIAEIVNFDHIRSYYFRSHKTINSTGIISIGPWQDPDEPCGRDVRFG